MRPVTWAVLEAVALEATAEGDEMVAYTSARRLAALLGLDPGTAANALRLLRRRDLVELRRTTGSTGRFGLSAYTLGDLGEVGLRPCVAAPGAVAPHAANPHGLSGGRGWTPPTEQPSGRRRSSAAGPRAQGALDLGLEADG